MKDRETLDKEVEELTKKEIKKIYKNQKEAEKYEAYITEIEVSDEQNTLKVEYKIPEEGISEKLMKTEVETSYKTNNSPNTIKQYWTKIGPLVIENKITEIGKDGEELELHTTNLEEKINTYKLLQKANKEMELGIDEGKEYMSTLEEKLYK